MQLPEVKKLLSFTGPKEEPASTAPLNWKMGADRRQVAVYVALALIGGFAIGFATSRYTSSQQASNRQTLPSRGQETVPDLSASALSPPDVGTDPSTYNFQKVNQIVRADTIEVETVGPVQMIGIDTPDNKCTSATYGAYGKDALAFTEKSLLGKRVRLEFDPQYAATQNKGPGGQTLAYVYMEDGTLFNGEMIKQGHAMLRAAEPFRLNDEFRGLEREAMQSMRGLWGFAGSTPRLPSNPPTEGPATKDDTKRRLAPLPPSEFGPNVPAVTGPFSASDQAVFVSAGDKTYHRAGCDYLGKKNHAMPLSQAKAEGYSSCSRCFASTVMKAR